MRTLGSLNIHLSHATTDPFTPEIAWSTPGQHPGWPALQYRILSNKIIFKRRDMSWHDLVSAQISNVCITRHAALNAIAYIVCVKQLVMSLPAISLGYWFSGSRKGGTGGGGLVYIPKW